MIIKIVFVLFLYITIGTTVWFVFNKYFYDKLYEEGDWSYNDLDVLRDVLSYAWIITLPLSVLYLIVHLIIKIILKFLNTVIE